MRLTEKQKQIVQHERESVYKAYLFGYVGLALPDDMPPKVEFICAYAVGQENKQRGCLHLIQYVLDQVGAYLGR